MAARERAQIAPTGHQLALTSFSAFAHRCGCLLHSSSFPSTAPLKVNGAAPRCEEKVAHHRYIEVRRDAVKTVHELASIDPSGTVTASRTGSSGLKRKVSAAVCVRPAQESIRGLRVPRYTPMHHSGKRIKKRFRTSA